MKKCMEIKISIKSIQVKYYFSKLKNFMHKNKLNIYYFNFFC